MEIPLTGTIRIPTGGYFNGILRMTLGYAAAHDTVDDRLVLADPALFPVSNGQLPSGAKITPNDILEPQHTWYVAEYFAVTGEKLAQNHYYVSGTSFDLGAAVPTNITTSNISFMPLEPPDPGYIEFTEMAAPGPGGANTARVYARDNGSGKTELVVQFPSGSTQILATEP